MNTIVKTAIAALVAGTALTGAAQARDIDPDRNPFMKGEVSSSFVSSDKSTGPVAVVDLDRNPFGVNPVQGEVRNSGKTFSVSSFDPDRNPFGNNEAEITADTLIAALGL